VLVGVDLECGTLFDGAKEEVSRLIKGQSSEVMQRNFPFYFESNRKITAAHQDLVTQTVHVSSFFSCSFL
jgi:hypothetical protein